jgi:hypothetical protein
MLKDPPNPNGVQGVGGVIGMLESFRKRQDKNQQADGADKAVRYGSCLHPQLTVRAFGEAAFV